MENKHGRIGIVHDTLCHASLHEPIKPLTAVRDHCDDITRMPLCGTHDGPSRVAYVDVVVDFNIVLFEIRFSNIIEIVTRPAAFDRK